MPPADSRRHFYCTGKKAPLPFGRGKSNPYEQYFMFIKGFAADNARPCRDHRLLIVSIGFPSQVMYEWMRGRLLPGQPPASWPPAARK